LVSRFERGLVTDLQPPDVETRLAILRKKELALGVQLPAEIMSFLATRIRTNVRRLEGALIRVAHFASLTSKPLTIDSVEDLLREVLQEEGYPVEWHEYPMENEVCAEELAVIGRWLRGVLQ